MFVVVPHLYFYILKRMHYKILQEELESWLLARLLSARGVSDDPEHFIQPTFSRYRQSPWWLNNIEKAVERIILAIERKEKIIVFGDYDVDGVSSSYIVYTFFKKFLEYPNISIRLPHRLNDWYGIKSYHLDEIKAAGASLVITVDNGITAVAEAIHAKELGIDMIITDHHKQLDVIPDGFAVVNPNVSPDFRFKEICGAAVAYKVILALAERLISDAVVRRRVLHYFLPIVTIATVADCMPLIDENRLLVKYGLERINARKWIPLSLKNFLDYLNITGPIDTYHIWFLMAPRLNAWWRMMTPYDSLYTLLHTGEKQLAYLQNLDALNTQRKKTQDDMMTIAESLLDPTAPAIVVWSEEFHEWVIWIVAGRLCDKYHKPTIVYGINKEEWLAVWSCRGPEYSNIVEMLYSQSALLDRFGGHKQAWGMTIRVENLPAFTEWVHAFASQWWEQEKKKILTIDTILLPGEYVTQSLDTVQSLAPFGEWNREPMFLIQWAEITAVEKVWKTGNWHMKLRVRYGETPITILYRWAGQTCSELKPWMIVSCAWMLKKDDFQWGVYLRGEGLPRVES